MSRRLAAWDRWARALIALVVSGVLVHDLLVDAGTRDRARAEAAAERTRFALATFLQDAPTFSPDAPVPERPPLEAPDQYAAALSAARAERAAKVARIPGSADRLVEPAGEEWLVVARARGGRAAVRWEEVVEQAVPAADAVVVRSETPVDGAARFTAIAASPPIWVMPRSRASNAFTFWDLYLYLTLVACVGSLAWDAWKDSRARAARAAEEATRDALLARLSHELRTPAASVRALVEALSSVAVAAEARARFLSLALTEADRLSVGVDRLLRAARGEAAPPPEPIPMDLSEWARSAVDRWRARLPGLRLEAPGTCPGLADPDRLDEAVDALLDNAARYGGPNVRLGLGPGPTFWVEDDGPGVPAEHRSRIFERLYRVERGPTDPGGHGLGLWVVAEVARAHGGRAMLVDGRRFVVALEEGK